MKNELTFSREPCRIRGILFHSLLWVLVLVYLESLLHAVVFHSLTARYFYILGFSVPVALLLSLLLGLLPKRVNGGVTIGLVSLLCIVFGSQLVYYFVFGTLYSTSQVGLGGDAITTFWKETLATMAGHAGELLLCILPIPAVCLVYRFLPETFARAGWRSRVVLAVIAVVLQVGTILSLRIGGTGFYTAYSFYYGNDATIDQAADSFGLLTALRLELFHVKGTGQENGYYTDLPAVDMSKPSPPTVDSPAGGEENQAPEYGRNILDIDFEKLNSLTEDEKLLAMNAYVESLSGTMKNEYTGMLSDYNLIVLCAESFSTAAIDPERTPPLYRLSHEGFVFHNYYNTYPNNTTDGEYSLCLGLLPDNTRDKPAPSFYASRFSYLPMALGNIFAEQRGIQSYGYHNDVGSYYGRQYTHPNMGYACKFAQMGMSFSTAWPASDLEMMEQSVSDYLSQEQFHAYYMTFSGHYKYGRGINPMVDRNYAQVKHLAYSETAKCYLSCNLELEKALTYLMERLEEAGVADRTAIVLAADHFPYGLTDAQYDELMGYECDFFERYHDTLIFWVGGMEEPIEVDTYCCNIDILPTILNLWGFDYDSRLLAGTDVFSDGMHMAMLVDQSFLTEDVRFETSTGTATWLTPEDQLPEGYLDALIRLVKNKFSFSTDILNNAYYNFIFDHGAAKVDKSSWHNYDTDPNKPDKETEETEGPPPEDDPGEGVVPEMPPEDVPPETGPEQPDTPPQGENPEQAPETGPEQPEQPVQPDPDPVVEANEG